MTTHTGNEGTIKVGGVVVGEFRTIQLDLTIGTVDDTVAGDAWETHQVLHKAWTGSCDALFDPDDGGQIACAIGASVTVEFYMTGTDSLDKKHSGTATVEKRTIKSSHSGLVEISLGLKGNGALAEATL